jgi:8-oxo-dGTP diphosphatase
MTSPEAGVSAAQCARTRCRLATAVLVDARGRLLLQERDQHAPVAPLQWGLVGGHVDPGEDWTGAVWRELREETGLDATAVPGLRLWRELDLVHAPKVDQALTDRWQIWIGRTDATDGDIVVGEGRQIVFVDPEAVHAGRLDLAPGAAAILRELLDSAEYAALAG